MKFRIVGMLLACLLATFSNTALLIETAYGETMETTEPPTHNIVRGSDGSIIETPPRKDIETPESNTIKIPGSTAKDPNGETVMLPGGIAAGDANNETTDTSSIKVPENLNQGTTDTTANETAEELPDEPKNILDSETATDSSSNTEYITDAETPDALSNGTEQSAGTEATNKTPEKIQDEEPADEDMISLVLPVMYDTEDSPLNFIMDPYGQMQESGTNSEEGKTLFFANNDGRYDYSSRSDWLEIISQNNVPVRVTVKAWAWNISNIHLTQDSSFYGDTTPSIYLALVDTNGNEIPLTSDMNASLDIEIIPGEDFYAFAMTGACNPNGDWQEITEHPYITVTWTVTSISGALQKEDLQDTKKSEDINDADNLNQESSTTESAEPSNGNESEAENGADESQTETEQSGNTVNKSEAELGKQEETVDKSENVLDIPENTAIEDSSAPRKPSNAADRDKTESDIADNSADDSDADSEQPTDDIWTESEESVEETKTESEKQDNRTSGDNIEPDPPLNENGTDIEN